MKLKQILLSLLVILSATSFASQSPRRAFNKKDAELAKAERAAQGLKEDCPFKTPEGHNGRSPAEADKYARALADGKQLVREQIIVPSQRAGQAR